MRLTLLEGVRWNEGSFLAYSEGYHEARLIPFIVAMEIPVSIAYPIVKKVFEQSELEPGDRTLMNLPNRNTSILELLESLLEAAYPNNICVVDNDGEYGSDINCYVYKLEYGTEFISTVLDIIEKPEEAVFYLESEDDLLRTLAHRALT